MKKLILLILALSTAIILTGCDSIGGEPDFQSMNWSEMSVTYWVNAGTTRERGRQFQISDPEVLRSLFGHLDVARIERYRVPVGNQIRLTASDGTVWQSCFVFEDRIDFGLFTNSQYAFNVHTTNLDFYDSFREICLRDLQTSFPDATLDHVILRGNSAQSNHPILNMKKQNKAEMATPRNPSDHFGS